MFIYFTDTFSSPPGPLIDNRTGCPWEVPTKGLLSISFQSAYMPPSIDSVATDDTIKILTSSIENQQNSSEKNSEKKTTMFVFFILIFTEFYSFLFY